MARPRLGTLCQQFGEMLSAGKTVNEAIKELRISRATAWRWRMRLGVPIKR